MNKYPYPAVLLMGYQRLGGLIERLEWTVYNRALATHGFSGAFPLSTLEQVSEIIKLIDRKTLLSELKKTVVRCLNRMEKQERVILVRHFVKGYAPAKVAESLGLGKSGYYYRLNGAVERLGAALAAEGYDERWFSVTYGANLWIRKLFRLPVGSVWEEKKKAA